MKQMHDHMTETGLSKIKGKSKWFNQCTHRIQFTCSKAQKNLVLALCLFALFCRSLVLGFLWSRRFGDEFFFWHHRELVRRREIRGNERNRKRTLLKFEHAGSQLFVCVLAITQRTRLNHVYFKRTHRNAFSVNAHRKLHTHTRFVSHTHIKYTFIHSRRSSTC